jgi:hypothetical protein
LVLRLYPAAWRVRYSDEMLEVIAQFPVTPWTVADFLLGALDARLHPDLIPGGILSMMQRVRTSLITIFCASVLFGLGWGGTLLVRDPLPAWIADSQRHPALLYVLETVQGTGIILILAIVIGGGPLVFIALREALRQWQRVLLLFLIPLLAIAGIGAFAIFALGASTTKVTPGDPHSPLTLTAIVLQFVLLLLLGILIVGGTAAVALVVARASVDGRFVRFALLPATIATAAMAMGLAATVTLASLSFQDASDLAPGNLIICAILMLAALALAFPALWRGLRAARVAEKPISAVQP